MKPNWYRLISRALEEGVTVGWNHAHKHADKLDPGIICDNIVEAQLNALWEVIDFDDDTRLFDKDN